MKFPIFTSTFGLYELKMIPQVQDLNVKGHQLGLCVTLNNSSIDTV